MFTHPAIHFVQYAVELFPQEEGLREALAPKKVFEAALAIEHPVFPDPEKTGAAFDESLADEDFQHDFEQHMQEYNLASAQVEALYDGAAVRLFEALKWVEHRLVCEKAQIYLPKDYARLPIYQPVPEEGDWSNNDHAIVIARGLFQANVSSDWQKSGKQLPPTALRFLKAAAYIDGQPQPRDMRGMAIMVCSLEDRQSSIHIWRDIRTADDLDPATDPMLAGTPFMGFHPTAH